MSRRRRRHIYLPTYFIYSLPFSLKLKASYRIRKQSCEELCPTKSATNLGEPRNKISRIHPRKIILFTVHFAFYCHFIPFSKIKLSEQCPLLHLFWGIMKTKESSKNYCSIPLTKSVFLDNTNLFCFTKVWFTLLTNIWGVPVFISSVFLVPWAEIALPPPPVFSVFYFVIFELSCCHYSLHRLSAFLVFRFIFRLAIVLIYFPQNHLWRRYGWKTVCKYTINYICFHPLIWDACKDTLFSSSGLVSLVPLGKKSVWTL